MSKYVIKNCPCLKHSDEIEIDNRCMSTQDDIYFFCEDNTDCVLKQIVELCRKAPILDADWVLNKLDIQEVE